MLKRHSWMHTAGNWERVRGERQNSAAWSLTLGRRASCAAAFTNACTVTGHPSEKWRGGGGVGGNADTNVGPGATQIPWAQRCFQSNETHLRNSEASSRHPLVHGSKVKFLISVCLIKCPRIITFMQQWKEKHPLLLITEIHLIRSFLENNKSDLVCVTSSFMIVQLRSLHSKMSLKRISRKHVLSYFTLKYKESYFYKNKTWPRFLSNANYSDMPERFNFEFFDTTICDCN